MTKQATVEMFMACDDGYIPFLAVTLASIKENRNKSRPYRTRILYTDIKKESIRRITEEFNSLDFRVEFINIQDKVTEISDRLHTRDYYSKSTYYRLFIPELFPELDKALYLDCDIAVTDDIARLFDKDIDGCFVGAIPDGFVVNEPALRDYAENRLALDSADDYFNAGILLMNLSLLRKNDFEAVFIELLTKIKFTVAQDQDYLNVICKNRVKYIGYEWNNMPLPRSSLKEGVKLVHYNLDMKPWHTDGIIYGELFFEYAKKCSYYEEILDIHRNYSKEEALHSKAQTAELVKTARREADDFLENKNIHAAISEILEKYGIQELVKV